MSWNDKVIVWEETEHEWDQFGEISEAPFQDIENLNAKTLIVWKELTLSTLVKDISKVCKALYKFSENPDWLEGFVLAVTSLNLIPLNINLIWKDEHAKQFLDLLHKDKGEQYFIRADFSKFQDIEYLLEYYIERGILIECEDRLYVQGRVLNRSHIKENS